MDTSRASLVDVAIFDPTLGTREGEEEKALLFYYPPTTPIHEKTRNIGLSQAFINFTSTFSPHQPCEVVHTVNNRQVFLNPEGSIWITMTVKNPVDPGARDEESMALAERDLEDEALKFIIRQIYGFFKLFNGSFTRIRSKYSNDVLAAKLARQLTPHITSIDFGLLDPFHTQNGVHYLPIDRNTYLRVQCFINVIEYVYPVIRHSVFLFDDHLVYSSVDIESLAVLYKYMLDNVSTGGPSVAVSKTPKLATASAGAPRRKGPSKLYDGFLTGPVPIHDDDCFVNAPHVFLGDDVEYCMILYHLRGAVMLFLLETPSPALTDVGFFRALEASILAHIDAVVADIGANTTAAAAAVQPQAEALDSTFVYVNAMNRAIKASLPDDRPFSRPVCRMLWRIRNDLDQSTEAITELDIRSDDEGWITGRKSDSRSLFVVLEGKKATLIEVSDEIRRLSQSTFGNIFIH